jgi:hypothetical protein
MAKKTYPEFHKALLDPSLYPSAPRRIKFEETRHCYVYKTGSLVYKIRKTGPVYSSVAIKERFAREALTLGKRWAPEVVQEVVAVVRSAEGLYSLGGEGTVVDYALRLSQLPDHYWLHRLIGQNKLTAVAVGRLARYLADHHGSAAAGEKAAEAGRPEHFRRIAEEILYQSKKYINLTVTQPMLDMIARPVSRFIDDSRKLFLHRQRKGRVVDGHGAFVPEHIFLRGPEVHAVAPLDASPKFRQLDVANDVATLLNELCRLDAAESADLFLKRYIAASRDRDLPRILAAYRTLQALRYGLSYSERLNEAGMDEQQRGSIVQAANAYFNQAVRAAREINAPA